MPSPRMLRRPLAVSVVVLGILLATAAPAFAHADLSGSDPAPGAVLTESPANISLEFTERISVGNGAIRVFDTDENRVDLGGVEVSNRVATLPLPTLDDGAYVVTWRVASDDGHPVSGAFTFQVGAGARPSATSRTVQGLATRLLADQGGDTVVGVAYGATRWLAFVGLALLIGGAAFALLWPGARRSIATRRVVRAGWWSTAAATIVGLVVYGPYVNGLGLDQVFSSSLLGDTVSERIGEVWLARLGLLVLAVPVLYLLGARERSAPDGKDTGEADEERARPLPVWWLPAAALLAILLASTPGLSGHAISGRWVNAAVVADTLHVLAMALWLGGIAALAATALRAPSTSETTAALSRFSRLALVCIGVVAATGTFQGIRQVGSLDALRSSEYGRILVVKLVLVAGVIVLAAFSREIVLRRSARGDETPAVGGVGGVDEADQKERGDLRRSIVFEVGLGFAVLAATALLVNSPPAYTAAATPDGEAAVTLNANKVSVDVTVTPATSGRNDVHVDLFTPDGVPLDAQELTVTFANPDRGVKPIDVPLRKLGPGHYLSPGFDLPSSGEWKVVAEPVLSASEKPSLTGTVTID